MSAPKHTPEPWWFCENIYSFAVGAGDTELAHVGQTVSRSVNLHERSRANAARIVACVNACAGIETDALQAARAAYDAAEWAMGILQRERDALAAALRRLTHPAADDTDVDDALALLAKLDGKP